jgi:hypothetical protein
METSKGWHKHIALRAWNCNVGGPVRVAAALQRGPARLPLPLECGTLEFSTSAARARGALPGSARLSLSVIASTTPRPPVPVPSTLADARPCLLWSLFKYLVRAVRAVAVNSVARRAV